MFSSVAFLGPDIVSREKVFWGWSHCILMNGTQVAKMCISVWLLLMCGLSCTKASRMNKETPPVGKWPYLAPITH